MIDGCLIEHVRVPSPHPNRISHDTCEKNPQIGIQTLGHTSLGTPALCMSLEGA